MRAALPTTLIVRTGAQEAANQTSELEEKLGFLRTFLLVFAYVALVVGAFIIFNTFSITVAQRTREFGLLRTLGASRAQIMRSVVEEGLLLGVAGSVVGLFAGIGLAPALDGLFKAFGADLPDNGTVLETRTVIVSLGVGIVITVLAGFFPALRATRVPPMAAMREGVRSRRAAAPSAVRSRCLAVVVAAGILVGAAPILCDLAVSDGALAGAPAAGAPLPRHSRARPRDRPDRELARHHRAPRARELGAPAGPHAGDRARADHRARARRVHLGARRGHEGDDRPGGQPLVRRQPDRAEHAQRRRRRPGGDRTGAALDPRCRQRHRDRLHQGPGCGTSRSRARP